MVDDIPTVVHSAVQRSVSSSMIRFSGDNRLIVDTIYGPEQIVKQSMLQDVSWMPSINNWRGDGWQSV